MRTKTKSFYCVFSDETDQLLRRLGSETKLKLATIIEIALNDFAKIHDEKQNGK